ncbi:lignin-forming anionic peroxidase [Ricinus communis]|uniref:Peroxidase n=1 Tax=Ricinus communis TaxID=3988 RepID=B9RC49_RICCO|nr:lignin-forming anionic peroxidase [Ricinus communis]EEF51120.1 Lignin-forming anionic peroxidase precursor, putative [Ricinus communis]|eukprot:XP_002509733.1 lignin-forming anionic peroxidase [Ricinus communis]
MASHLSFACMILTIFFIPNYSSLCQAQLSSNFYDNTCPNALTTIKSAIDAAIESEQRMAASLIRLHFHDCFVQGCDGSVLLVDTPTFTGEKSARNNANSIRGENVIDDAKAQVESICPGIVSCADILAVAARDASVAAGGPSWTVNLGRRDSTTASLAQANSDLPGFSDPLNRLISLFSDKGLNERDMVALSGAHTIGQAQCVTFRDRIYNNASDIDPDFAATRRGNCPQTGGNGNLAPLDLVTPNNFDNNYYSNLMAKRGLLASDQILFSGGSTDSIVNEYSTDSSSFDSDFAAAMVKMGNISPLTGTQGEIRRLCSAVN